MRCKLKEIREKLGVTQEALEDMSGVSRVTISKIESNDGNYNPSTKTMLKIAMALGLTINDFFYDDCKPELTKE